MSGGRSGEASAIAALALAIQHAPARHTELLRGIAPLPSGVNVLLRLAGGTDPQDLDTSLSSLAAASELRKAALFFIEQVLFRRDATHYHVLGLNPGAAPEQIKEHHRLLMRLFHPDRGSLLDEREEQFATRANLAYNTLRDADARSRYDETLKPMQAAPRQAANRPSPHRPAPFVRRRMVQPESFWAVRVYPVLMRYLPQWVLAGTALVSLTVVGAVYLFNPPAHLQQTVAIAAPGEAAGNPQPSDAATDKVVTIAATEAAGLDEVVAQFERKIAAAIEMPADAAAPIAEAAPAPPAKPVEAVPEKTSPAVRVRSVPQSVAAQKSAQFPQPGPAPKPTAVTTAKPAVNVSRAAVPAAVRPEAPAVVPPAASEPARPVVAAVAVVPATVAPAPIAPPPVAPPAAEPSPLPDPNTLMKRFLEAYERGDMQACMALLDDGLRADVGGKPEIRREYDALFRGTDLRHIKILNMNWSRDGEFIRGEGRYRATQMRKGETLLRSQDGQVRVEMVRRGGSALINELYYIAGGRS